MAEPAPAFRPDPFQLDACAALDRGHSVLVAAPTSSGKTYVAEHAIEQCLDARTRCFYTAPIKALSNQKFSDFGIKYGRENVGLVTGDNVIRPDAPVVVMTTEVLRNMLYTRPEELGELSVVVLDEIHYLADRYRGPVWEEVLIHLEPSVRVVCLSATVSNADEIRDWLEQIRGDVELIASSERPVPLTLRYLYADTGSRRVIDLELLGAGGEPSRSSQRQLSAASPRTPRRPEVVRHLRRNDALPSLYFIFSRAGCEDAVRACLRAGLQLVDGTTAAELDQLAHDALSELSPSERRAVGAQDWARGLRAGLAAHHAGLITPVKEATEKAFARGILPVVFATETLAMGVNLPARSVVVEALSTYREQGHRMLTPAELTQLTGRAGRRGMDERGTAFLLWSRWVGFQEAAAIAASGDHDLRSAFRPTYNMAVNLVQSHTRRDVHDVLGQSLAQFHADRAGLSARQRVAKLEGELTSRLDRLDDEAREHLERLKRSRSRSSSGRTRGLTEAAIARLTPGEIIDSPTGGPVVVLSTASRARGAHHLRAVDARGHVSRLMARDFSAPPEGRGRLRLPRNFVPTKRSDQKRLAAALRKRRHGLRGGGSRDIDPQVDADARAVLRLEDRARQARARQAEIEVDLVGAFDSIIEELTARGFLSGWNLTGDGRMLSRLFVEDDLLVAEGVRNRVFDDLDPANLAAVVSTVVYEPRGRERAPEPWFPPGPSRSRFRQLRDLARGIQSFERGAGLDLTTEPEPGFMAAAHAWVLGEPLDGILDEEDLTGGDFVRTARRLIDLLKQLARVGRTELAPVAAAAIEGLDTGVVALSARVGDEDAG